MSTAKPTELRPEVPDLIREMAKSFAYAPLRADAMKAADEYEAELRAQAAAKVGM
jgi:hypothetical protein